MPGVLTARADRNLRVGDRNLPPKPMPPSELACTKTPVVPRFVRLTARIVGAAHELFDPHPATPYKQI
jgi:hypothetical protein